MRKNIYKVRRSHNSLVQTPQIREDITRYSNGEMKSKTPYVDGKKHGVDTGWHENGRKSYEKMWRDGNSHGVEIGWYESRLKHWEKMRKDGKEHGRGTWWWDNGQKRWEIMWRDGEHHGMDTTWDYNGQKRIEAYYIRDKEYAIIEWDEEGNITSVKFPIHSPIINPTVKSKKNHTNTQVS